MMTLTWFGHHASDIRHPQSAIRNPKWEGGSTLAFPEQRIFQAVKLSEISIGTTAVLAEFDTTPLHLHLLAMGIGPGTLVKIIRRFPMRGGVYIQIGSRYLVMRNAEASQLQVTKPV